MTTVEAGRESQNVRIERSLKDYLLKLSLSNIII